MKFRLEQDANCTETEILLRFSSKTEEIEKLEKLIAQFLNQNEKIVGFQEEKEFFLSPKDILFFQTEENFLFAHTSNNFYLTKYKLYELEEKLPPFFQRISKSTIVNTEKVLSSQRELNGSALLSLFNSNKTIYCSRNYYAELKNKLLRTY